MSTEKKRTSALPIYIAVAILVLFSVIFLIEFIGLSDTTSGVEEERLTAETYMAEVEPLLVDADPLRGREAVALRGCNACHEGENAGRLAPGHENVGEVAAERHPPLTAAAYIYEAIVYPGAYVVEGYQNNMPRVYREQIPDEELGDIIAYLLLSSEEKAALDG